jgi:hypothetical protein
MAKRLSLSAPTAFVIAALFAVAGFAQTDPRGKSRILNGTVEVINDFARSIRVNQEKIEGYSDARTATYNVDDATILKRLAVGDRIVATIYEKDYYTLYDIRIVEFYDPPSKPTTRPKR